MQNTLTSIQNYGHHQDPTRATTQSQTLKAMEDTCSCLHSLEQPYQQLSPLSQRVLGKPRMIQIGRASCRERVKTSVDAAECKKNKQRRWSRARRDSTRT